ncbi:MAG: alpha/beta hydrolase [Rhodobacteraceae bacterium]|nr:alpha/beta hydrolase [Paracoccaceae bacterium]
MMIWWVIIALIVLVFSLPFLLERSRKPIGAKAIRNADGGFAQLSHGLTHYQWHGRKSEQVLVLIHGLSTPSWVFAGLVPGLTMMGFNVLTYDLYGRGLSGRPKAPQTKEFFVAQLHELLEDQGIVRDFSLLGYSMGGAIATAFAAKEPDRVDRLILLASAGIDYQPAPLLARAARSGRFGNWLWGVFGARHLRMGAMAEARLPTTLPDLPGRMRKETRSRGYLAAILSSERNMLAEVLEDEHRALAESHVAVVSIWGEKDRVIPLSSVGKLTEWNRGAYKYVIANAVHSLGYTNPKEVLAAIQENLREV